MYFSLLRLRASSCCGRFFFSCSCCTYMKYIYNSMYTQIVNNASSRKQPQSRPHRTVPSSPPPPCSLLNTYWEHHHSIHDVQGPRASLPPPPPSWKNHVVVFSRQQQASHPFFLLQNTPPRAPEACPAVRPAPARGGGGRRCGLTATRRRPRPTWP